MCVYSNWEGILEEMETMPKASTNAELMARYFNVGAFKATLAVCTAEQLFVFLQYLRMDPKELAKMPFDFALYLMLLSLGTYTNLNVPPLDAPSMKRMQESISCTDDTNSEALTCVRFWLFAARSILKARPQWTASTEVWQAQIIGVLLLENLGLDVTVYEDLGHLARTTCQIGLELTECKPSQDPSVVSVPPELLRGRIDAAVSDLSFWSLILNGQPLLHQSTIRHPNEDKVRRVTGPWQMSNFPAMDSTMDDSMFGSYMTDCLFFAKEAQSLVYAPDYAKVEDLTVSSLRVLSMIAFHQPLNPKCGDRSASKLGLKVYPWTCIGSQATSRAQVWTLP